jgi:hypothetical protein
MISVYILPSVLSLSMAWSLYATKAGIRLNKIIVTISLSRNSPRALKISRSLVSKAECLSFRIYRYHIAAYRAVKMKV